MFTLAVPGIRQMTRAVLVMLSTALNKVVPCYATQHGSAETQLLHQMKQSAELISSVPSQWFSTLGPLLYGGL